MTDEAKIRELRTRPHLYVSTACRHELHDQCRLTCKWCSAPCMCRCHRGDDPPADAVVPAA
jgi:hypothetical protein